MPSPDGSLSGRAADRGASADRRLQFFANDATWASSPARRRAYMWVYGTDVDGRFDRAVKAGCKVVMPLSDAFWGDRWGMWWSTRLARPGRSPSTRRTCRSTRCAPPARSSPNRWPASIPPETPVSLPCWPRRVQLAHTRRALPESRKRARRRARMTGHVDLRRATRTFDKKAPAEQPRGAAEERRRRARADARRRAGAQARHARGQRPLREGGGALVAERGLRPPRRWR